MAEYTQFFLHGADKLSLQVMSGSIRKQLGPIRKRLCDRISEATKELDDSDVRRLKDIRTKLAANIASHEKIYVKLSELTDVTEEDQIIIDKELEASTELNIDANEIYELLTGRIDESLISQDASRMDAKTQKDKKIEYEIEKLKVETEYARSKMEKLNNGSSDGATPKIKLPVLALPSFTGTITDWPSFWDSFSSTIHLNERVSKVDKFKYLMTSLKGDAKNTLTGFNLTEAQYDSAVALLKERYDDKEYIIHKHYAALSSTRRCSNSTRDLRQTFNFLETQIRSLEGMGESIENSYLVALIKEKMPGEFNVKLEETREGNWTVALLRKTINKLILAREKSEDRNRENEIGNRGRSEQDEKHEYEKELEYTGEGLLSKEFKVKCVFCDGSHWADECQKFKSLSERKAQVKGRCFVCLSPKHFFRQCPSDKACFYCKRKSNHHSSLCPTKFGGEVELVELGGKLEVNMEHDVIMKTALYAHKPIVDSLSS